jgi:hypothetical protein
MKDLALTEEEKEQKARRVLANFAAGFKELDDDDILVKALMNLDKIPVQRIIARGEAGSPEDIAQNVRYTGEGYYG